MQWKPLQPWKETNYSHMKPRRQMETNHGGKAVKEMIMVVVKEPIILGGSCDPEPHRLVSELLDMLFLDWWLQQVFM